VKSVKPVLNKVRR